MAYRDELDEQMKGVVATFLAASRVGRKEVDACVKDVLREATKAAAMQCTFMYYDMENRDEAFVKKVGARIEEVTDKKATVSYKHGNTANKMKVYWEPDQLEPEQPPEWQKQA